MNNKPFSFVRSLVPLPIRISLSPYRKRFKTWTGRLWGHRFCPVCQHRVWDFDPLTTLYTETTIAHGGRPGKYETLNERAYSCPSCGADDRCRMFALYLERYFAHCSPGNTVRILDIAPSPCLSAFIRSTAMRLELPLVYRTADLKTPWVDDKLDITDMSCYGDAMFDFFICSHVLEHVPNDHLALRELCRILRPGGEGILMVPVRLDLNAIDEDPATSPAERWRRFGAAEHVRSYSKQGFVRRVEEAGFRVWQFGLPYFGTDVFHRCDIDAGSILYVAEKPAAGLIESMSP